MAVDMNMRILVVDDQRTMVRIIRNLLNQLGFTNIEDASSGEAALEKLRYETYALVISDWNMNGMSGNDLLRRIRADAHLSTLKFIMVTAESKMENIVAAKNEGVNNYIVKPFSVEVLKQKIASVVGLFRWPRRSLCLF